MAIAPGGGDDFFAFGEAVSKNGLNAYSWNMPADCQTDDLLVAFFWWYTASVGLSVPGWTLIQSTNSGTCRGGYLRKVWNGTDPLTVDVTTTTTAEINCATMRFRGPNTTTPTIDTDKGKSDSNVASFNLGIIAGGGSPDVRLLVASKTSSVLFSQAPSVTNGPAALDVVAEGATSGVSARAYQISTGAHGGDASTVYMSPNNIGIAFTTYLNLV